MEGPDTMVEKIGNRKAGGGPGLIADLRGTALKQGGI